MGNGRDGRLVPFGQGKPAAPAPVLVDGFDLHGAHDEAHRLVARAKQPKRVTDATLERIVAEGSDTMRVAALASIAERDPLRAEYLARGVVTRLKKAKDMRRAAQLLLELGTDGATDLAIEQYLAEPRFDFPVKKLADSHRARLFARLEAWLPRLDVGSGTVRLALGLADVFASPLVPAASRRAFAAAITARHEASGSAADPRDELHEQAIQTLWSLGDEGVRTKMLLGDSPTISFAVRARVLLASDPARAYDLFVDDFRSSPDRHHAILDALDARADPRWAHEVLALAHRAPAAMTAVLARMRAADELTDLAARPELDEIARCALHALAKIGDPRGSRMLVDWLQRPEGDQRAPMILTALASCGDLEAAAYLETQLSAAGSRRAFFQFAIDGIRARFGAKLGAS
jgi:hypothetical protein